jgi:SAM-dependent methyltransferase
LSYDPKAFWEQRLGEHFDLVGTGETGLSLAYNRACYALRSLQLERALRQAHLDVAGKRVLDVGCGTGFFTDFYLRRGAEVTGLDITTASVERLRRRFPQSRFILGDVSDSPLDAQYDVIHAFDVLYHITDPLRWERAVRHLAAAVAPGGAFVFTDVFDSGAAEASHNVSRPLATYRSLLESQGLAVRPMVPTHVLLNRHLGPFRFLNRVPGVLYAFDRAVLSAGGSWARGTNAILVAQRPAGPGC